MITRGADWLFPTKIQHTTHITRLTDVKAYVDTCDTADMPDFSILVSKAYGSDQVKQPRREGLRSRNKGKSDQKLSPQQLFKQVIDDITNATEHKYFTYEGVDPDTGSWVVDSLDQNARVERMRPR